MRPAPRGTARRRSRRAHWRSLPARAVGHGRSRSHSTMCTPPQRLRKFREVPLRPCSVLSGCAVPSGCLRDRGRSRRGRRRTRRSLRRSRAPGAVRRPRRARHRAPRRRALGQPAGAPGPRSGVPATRRSPRTTSHSGTRRPRQLPVTDVEEERGLVVGPPWEDAEVDVVDPNHGPTLLVCARRRVRDRSRREVRGKGQSEGRWCRAGARESLPLTSKERSMLHLPARDIPVPTSVSPEAQAALAMGRLGPPAANPPRWTMWRDGRRTSARATTSCGRWSVTRLRPSPARSRNVTPGRVPCTW